MLHSRLRDITSVQGINREIRLVKELIAEESLRTWEILGDRPWVSQAAHRNLDRLDKDLAELEAIARQMSAA